jgi:hypothetical protein
MNNRFIYYGILIILITSCSGTPENHKKIIGSWLIVSVKVTGKDGNPELRPVHKNEVKLFSESHFSFGYQDADSTMAAGGGLYKISGDSLFEYVQYHSMTSLTGKEFHFKIRFEGNRYFQRGVFNGQITEEEWERIK